MASNSSVPQPPGRRIVLLTKVKSPMRLGAMTLAFFRKGEDLEATQFENLPHDDPALVPPKLGFRSFDRVPRHRGPLLVALLVVVVASLTVVGWSTVRAQGARAAVIARAKLSVEWQHLKQWAASRHAAP